MSCADCHQQERAFTDGHPRALGHGGKELDFNSMSLVNLLWGPSRFFWDGRSPTLEHQALEPLKNPDEMRQSLVELVDELKASSVYQDLFWRAYGDTTQENVAKALATFMRMLISADSKYDRYLRGELRLTPQEERGRKLFMAHPDVKVSLRGGNCIDCHSQFVTAGFSDGWDGFLNNGLDTDQDLAVGLEAVTEHTLDKGKFKTPTLRNIAVTAPYMHDGRFNPKFRSWVLCPANLGRSVRVLIVRFWSAFTHVTNLEAVLGSARGGIWTGPFQEFGTSALWRSTAAHIAVRAGSGSSPIALSG